MIALVEGADRQKTPNEIALNILLVGLTIVFMLAVATIQPFAVFSSARQRSRCSSRCSCASCPTTIGALLSAIGIAGMDRLVQRNVLAMSGRAVEAAGDVSTLLLDKTGTITYGNRMAAEFIPAGGVDERTLAEVVLLSSLSDETPEGRSIVDARRSRATGSRRSTCPAPSSCRSRLRPACRASSGRAARSARARPTPCSVGSTEQGGPGARRPGARGRAHRATTAGPRWSSPRATARSV